MVSRRKVVQVKLETDRGTAVTPDLPLSVSDPRIDSDAEFIERKLAGASGGHAQGYVNVGPASIGFRVEMRGDGATAAFDAALAALLQCCGFKLATGVYAPCHAYDGKCCTISFHEDGLLKLARGCAGEVTFEGEAGGRVYAVFDLKGVWADPTDVAVPAVTLNATVAPRFESCTFTIDSANRYIDRLSLKMGNNVQARQDVASANGILHYYVADRDPQLTLTPEAALVAGYDWFGKWKASTQFALSLLVGGTTFNKFTLACPKLQIRSMKGADRNGVAAHETTFQANYNTGDDDVTLTPA